MKTVSAAATGTVPMAGDEKVAEDMRQRKEGEGSVGRLDLYAVHDTCYERRWKLT